MCNIIHTDLKPENVLVCLTDKEIEEIQKNGFLDIKKKKNKENDPDGNKKDKDDDNENDTSKLTEKTGDFDPDNAKKKKAEKNKRHKMKTQLAKKL